MEKAREGGRKEGKEGEEIAREWRGAEEDDGRAMMHGGFRGIEIEHKIGLASDTVLLEVFSPT